MATDVITTPTAGTYTVDKAHTEVGFVARHLIGTKVRGKFTEFDATLKSAGLTKESDSEWKLAGDLTVRGVTKPVVFDLEYHGSGPSMQPGGEVVAFSATTEIDRRDFGVSFNHALDNGGLVVGNKVKIELEVEAGLDK